MYLAEDRVRFPLSRIIDIPLILFTCTRSCAGSLSQNVAAHGSFTMSKSAYAVTDVPDQVPELISQRRRWLNGSFFAAVHSTVHFHYIYRSSHTFVRKAWIHVEMFYQLFNLIFSWFALVCPCLLSTCGVLLMLPAGKLLHRVLDPVAVTGRHILQPAWDQDSQHNSKLRIPRPAHHVLHPLAR